MQVTSQSWRLFGNICRPWFKGSQDTGDGLVGGLGQCRFVGSDLGFVFLLLFSLEQSIVERNNESNKSDKGLGTVASLSNLILKIRLETIDGLIDNGILIAPAENSNEVLS